MTHLRRLVSFAVVFLAMGEAPGHGQTSPVASLRWLAGRWELQADRLSVEEQWLEPRAGILVGVSRSSRGESLVGFEFMRIFSRGDTLIFAAQPSGQELTEFVAVSSGSREVIFENLEHDFPQRVSYRAVGSDSLIARVEGVRGGQLQGSEFPYGRVTCAGLSGR